MKTSGILLIVLTLIYYGCTGNSSPKNSDKAVTDTVSVPDTGYTGIKKYFSGDNLIKEVTFRNGVREGLMRSFYQGGQLYQTFWYENNLKEDSAKWYYTDGRVFRSSPYVHDTIDGIQKQYYRNGKVKAKIGYSKGLRTPLFEEYSQEGRLVKNYPEILVKVSDEYNTKGTYRIGLELSDKYQKVKFYRGDFTDGRFDTSKCKIINTVAGKGSLNLKKSGSPTSGSVGIIAEIVTGFGNKYITQKNIELPYNDLK